ncbi:MAG: hypothetical protein K2P94_08425 [Rhodospirillaceae bacterium]|nr:hypothetical protein [Rhodospirillaceae bacterium]
MRLRISEGLGLYFSDLGTRAKIDSILENERPSAALGMSHLSEWIAAKTEAQTIPLDFYVLMGRLWSATWGVALKDVAPSPAADEMVSTLREELEPNSYASVTSHDVWASKTIERFTSLRASAGKRGKQRTQLRTAVMVTIGGEVHLSLAVESPFRIRRLVIPGGWKWSDLAHAYEHRSGIKVRAKHIDISPLRGAARNAVDAFAKVHLSNPTSRAAA